MGVFGPVLEALKAVSPWLILLANDLTLIVLFVRALLSETLVLGRHRRAPSGPTVAAVSRGMEGADDAA